uniref:Uncharacterized protein n=1 Tax=Octactis speculum TaxID=3111310 RepID=A0A7S2D8D8_9STRA|mmetsp:Transcript_44856/g.61291  ORF Transcript_44856/g.61291 Transcript_44856/m.61291 type:complete len:478 (+) Transcript_44856:124-1557(+)|eukprot:CAMPEP_0185744496 /NCGR_PEP_ID=MMETSP1174-20130828/2631_1 /TAXON_ID=35687 /ORGANISM="Dictyocha speculum, Strain CCMP1381" /LENGTH=477 /DNA_ID=CAMNT_0028417941 /DNA_START=103 /DNA_END=1536 /DNA_ORIENTATION=+
MNNALSRTPPQNTPSSYGRHVAKRGRNIGATGSQGQAGSASWGQFGGRANQRKNSADTGKLSTSLAGRLRSVSDLERAGFVTSTEKGALKDLIITGDESLRCALDKYQAGDSSELEALISRGYLDRNGSIDLTELDNLDLGSLGLEGMDFLGMFDQQGVGNGSVSGAEGEFDYDFGGSSAGFEMDDILSLPFPGMDEIITDDMTGVIEVEPHPIQPATTAHGLMSVVAMTPSPSMNPPSTTTVSAPPKRSTPTATPAASTSGMTAFPNSACSGNKFPVSNCVSELPALISLPQGQAPAYEQLINFQRAKSKDAIRCVMCGKAPTEGDGGTVIPQQNKDVCRDCDKALWVHGETRTYFKWCKGCKRFRNIVAFSEKLDASKCNGCRERGRRSYLQRKGVNGQPAASAAAAAAAAAVPAPAAQPLPLPPTPAVVSVATGNASVVAVPTTAVAMVAVATAPTSVVPIVIKKADPIPPNTT